MLHLKSTQDKQICDRWISMGWRFGKLKSFGVIMYFRRPMTHWICGNRGCTEVGYLEVSIRPIDSGSVSLPSPPPCCFGKSGNYSSVYICSIRLTLVRAGPSDFLSAFSFFFNIKILFISYVLKNVFIWPCRALVWHVASSIVVAFRIFICRMWTLHCGLWDLIPQPGTELQAPCIGSVES